MNENTNLNSILIDDYDLILKKYSLVSKYCLRNEIKTIGELLNKYDNNELTYHSRMSEEEISGLIDLIRYRHFGSCLPEESLLLEEIKFIESSYRNHPCDGINDAKVSSKKFQYPLKRLGLTVDECNILKNYVIRHEHSLSVINSIIGYRNDTKRKLIYKYKAQSIFDKKLDLLISYYNKCIIQNKSLEKNKYVELEQLFYNYRNICEEIKRLNINLDNLNKEIYDKKKYISEDSFKKMEKIYKIDN